MSNDLSELTRVGDWVHECIVRYGVPLRAAERLDLCSTEVVTNIMMHGYAEPGAHQILLRLDRRDDHVAFEVHDDGAPFDPRLVEAPARPTSLADAEVGGWGIQLVRHFSDGWDYTRSEGRNHLTLLFRLTDTAGGPPPQT